MGTQEKKTNPSLWGAREGDLITSEWSCSGSHNPGKGGNYVVTAQWKETAWACGRLASQEHGEVFWLKVGVLVGQGRGKPLPVRGLWLQQHSRRCSQFHRSLGK